METSSPLIYKKFLWPRDFHRSIRDSVKIPWIRLAHQEMVLFGTFANSGMDNVISRLWILAPEVPDFIDIFNRLLQFLNDKIDHLIGCIDLASEAWWQDELTRLTKRKFHRSTRPIMHSMFHLTDPYSEKLRSKCRRLFVKKGIDPFDFLEFSLSPQKNSDYEFANHQLNIFFSANAASQFNQIYKCMCIIF